MAGRPHDTVWLRDDQRERKPRLSLERIVDAAIDLLDVEGVDGFSMRRLAARLDAGTMSLYEYVRTREDVLDLALDAVWTEITLDEPEGAGWQVAVTRHLQQSRRVMRRHPWIPALTSTRPLLGPNALARSERFYTSLRQAGLDGPPLLAAVGTLTYYVQGFVAAENIWRTVVRDTSDEAEVRRQAQAHIEKHAHLYPTLSRHAQLDNADFDGQFTLGLQIILDGIEQQRRPQEVPARKARR